MSYDYSENILVQESAGHLLERELGCPLVRRSKGRRHIELTEQGERFIATARKWRELWRETRELAAGEQKTQLRLTSVGSVSTYLLPPVFKSFLQQIPGSLEKQQMPRQ